MDSCHAIASHLKSVPVTKDFLHVHHANQKSR